MRPAHRSRVPHDLGLQTRSSLWPHAIVAAIVAFIVVSRLLQARESLWLDELHTAWTAAASWADVTSRAAAGNQSALFFWLEWTLIRLLGAGELTLRLPSLIAGALLPVVLFRTTREWTGSVWLGVLAAWLVAVDPQAIYFGTEARPYALIQLLAVLHASQFAKVIARPTMGRRVMLVSGMVLLFYLHYTAILLLAAEVAWYILFRAWRRGSASYTWNALAMDVAAVGLLSLGALPVLSAVYARHENWERFVDQRPLWEAIWIVPWGWTAIVTLVVAEAARLRFPGDGAEKKRDAAPSTLWLVLCWMLAPVLIAWLATATNIARLLHPRYVAAATPAAIVLLALALQRMPWPRVRLALAAGMAVVALPLSHIPVEIAANGRLIGFRRDDWRSAVGSFNEKQVNNRDPILLQSLLIESDALRTTESASLREYCLYPVTSLYKIEASRDRLIPLPLTQPWRFTPAVSRQIQAAQGIWLIAQTTGAARTDIAQRFATALTDVGDEGARRSSAWTISSAESFGNVHVLRFERIGH